MARGMLIALLVLGGCMDPVSRCVSECGSDRDGCIHDTTEEHEQVCHEAYKACLDVCKAAK